ncbi:MAG: hypothetical protein R2865_07170 [Deinococcales bacterium]
MMRVFAEQSLKTLSDIPLWIPSLHHHFMQVNNEKALSLGLKPRSLADSLADIHNWLKENPKDKLKAGLNLDQERELLATWHQI